MWGDGGNMATTAWYRDPVAAFSEGRALQFFPTREMDVAGQLNATFRFALYYGALASLLSRSLRPARLTLVVAMATAALFEARAGMRSASAETFLGGLLPEARPPCVAPTVDNPFMNVALGDRPDRAPACDVTEGGTKVAMERAFPSVPSDDHFAGGRTDRQFYTMPSTTVPNDQGGFADALYRRTGPSAKGY